MLVVSRADLSAIEAMTSWSLLMAGSSLPRPPCAAPMPPMASNARSSEWLIVGLPLLAMATPFPSSVAVPLPVCRPYNLPHPRPPTRTRPRGPLSSPSPLRLLPLPPWIPALLSLAPRGIPRPARPRPTPMTPTPSTPHKNAFYYCEAYYFVLDIEPTNEPTTLLVISFGVHFYRADKPKNKTPFPPSDGRRGATVCLPSVSFGDNAPPPPPHEHAASHPGRFTTPAPHVAAPVLSPLRS